MAVAGACPGMVLTQVGTAVPDAWATLLGGVIGATAFGLLEPVFRPHLGGQREAFLDEKLEKPYQIFAIPFAVVLAGVSILLEVLVPYAEDAGQTGALNPDAAAGAGPLALPIWYPSLCGFGIGMLQLPAGLLLQDSLGGSGGYETFGAQMLRFVPTNEHLAKKREGGLGTHWQMIYMLFAMGGSAVSAALSGSLPSSAKGVGLPAAFVGGAIMLFGSRFGAGCTSGHGISGMPLLYPVSVLAVCTMFGAGIATAFALQAAGVWTQ
jgi:hypothetical protein